MTDEAPPKAPTLHLDPANAALSLRVRVRQIIAAQIYVRDTYARYEGLRSLDRELERMGVLGDVLAICGVPAATVDIPSPNNPNVDEGEQG
jgi:hypothetical protein